MRNLLLIPIIGILLCCLCGCHTSKVSADDLAVSGVIRHDSVSATVSESHEDSAFSIIKALTSSESSRLEIEYNDSGVPKKLLLQTEKVSRDESEQKTEKSVGKQDATLDIDDLAIFIDSLYQNHWDAEGKAAKNLTQSEQYHDSPIWNFIWGMVFGAMLLFGVYLFVRWKTR